MRIGLGIGAAAVALAAMPSPGARASGYPDCAAAADAKHAALDKPGRSSTQQVMIPGEGGEVYTADVFAPKPLPTDRLAAPGVVVMHGIDGNPCAVRWIARLLAGKGYFVVSPYRLPTTDPVQHADDKAEVLKHVAAERAAYEYLRSSTFPYSGYVSPDDISLVGHSLGASAAAVLQGDDLDGLQTIVALDGLRHYAAHDPGLPFNCSEPRQLPITPVVPALGFASEAVCPTSPHPHNPELRKTGYRRWHKAHVPAAVLALRGFQHTTFAGSGPTKKLRRVAHLMLPWLNHYQRGATGNALVHIPHGWLSTQFTSAGYLPAQNLNCADLLTCGP